MHNVIGECPICHSDLKVTKLQCVKCHTEISGNFTLSKFNYLSKEHLFFIEVFIKNKGNIKAIEKELGISYPTVKKNLENVIQALGYAEDEKSESLTKKQILERLSEGKISSEKAMKLIKGL